MKKTLSIIIAAAMLISLVPSAFAADKELEVKYNFDFGAAGYGETAEIGSDTLKTYGDLSTESQDSKEGHTWATKNTDPWVVDGHRYVTTLALTGSDVGTSTTKQPNSIYAYVYNTRVWGSGAKKTAAGIVVRLQIDKAGTYVPELTYYPHKGLAMYDVYLVSLKTKNYYLQASDRNSLTFNNSKITSSVYTVLKANSKTFLGQINMYDTDETAKSVRLNSYTISEEEAAYGQFALFFYPNGMDEKLTTGVADSNIPHQYINIDSFRLLGEKKEEISLDPEFAYSEEDYTGGSTSLRAFAVYGTDGEVNETEIIETPVVTYGSTTELSAPETVTKGEKIYKFLYWAKGATMERKKIISHEAAFSYKPYEGANHLLAVYEEADAENAEKAEYYNANGELLANGNTLPSMPGYGVATGWTEYKDGIFVAEYGDLAKNIEITVNGEKKNYAYGDAVSCEAVAPEGKVFMYWTKNGDIVSTANSYSFCAWENATVEAVFGDAAPTLGKTMRKIILDGFAAGNESAIMAEFIGFDDALEKGIMFGNKRVAMTGDAMQFAVIDDIENADAVGYAIVREGGELKLITDGELSE